MASWGSASVYAFRQHSWRTWLEDVDRVHCALLHVWFSG